MSYEKGDLVKILEKPIQTIINDKIVTVVIKHLFKLERFILRININNIFINISNLNGG